MQIGIKLRRGVIIGINMALEPFQFLPSPCHNLQQPASVISHRPHNIDNIIDELLLDYLIDSEIFLQGW